MISENIYAKDSKGVLRFWRYIIEGDKWAGISGQVNGAETQSGWSHCEPKSQDTAEEQAIFEANAEMKKKLDRKYRASIEELEAATIFTQPMLAHEYDKLKKPIVFPVYAQPKLDGIRAIISANGAFTRQGQPIPSADFIVADLEELWGEFPDLELDGELYNHDLKEDFNTLSSVIRKGFKLDKKALKAGVSEEQQRADFEALKRKVIQYHVYDVVEPTMTTEERQDYLEKIFITTFDFSDIIHLVETFEVHDLVELDTLLERWLIDNYEGQMVRLIKALYEHTRSKSLLKRKDFETKEFKLLRIEEGNGNWKGLAKRVVVELEDGRENEAGIRGNMPFCKALLENKAEYEGGEVTLRFMRQRTPDGKLRAVTAIDFHPDGRKD